MIKKYLSTIPIIQHFFIFANRKKFFYYQFILLIMKKLSYILMAMGLVFCVSCNQNNDTKSPADENTVIETETTTVESTPKYEGSPAYVEIMTYFDNTEAQLENCSLEQYKLIHKMTYETVLAKYDEDDITPEENEELRVRYGQFVEKVAEKAKDFDMAE